MSNSKDLVIAEMTRDTRQKVKVLASLEGMTIPDWLGYMVGRAYEATLINNKRPHLNVSIPKKRARNK